MKSDFHYNAIGQLVFSLEVNDEEVSRNLDNVRKALVLGGRVVGKDKIRDLFADLIIMDELTVQANPVKKNEPWYRKQGKQRC